MAEGELSQATNTTSPNQSEIIHTRDLPTNNLSKSGSSTWATVAKIALVIILAIGAAVAVFVYTKSIPFTAVAGGGVLAVALAIWGITRCCASSHSKTQGSDSQSHASTAKKEPSEKQQAEGLIRLGSTPEALEEPSEQQQAEELLGLGKGPTLTALIKAKARTRRAGMGQDDDDQDLQPLNRIFVGAQKTVQKLRIPRLGDSSATGDSSSETSSSAGDSSTAASFSDKVSEEDLSFENGADPQPNNIAMSSTTPATPAPPTTDSESSATSAASAAGRSTSPTPNISHTTTPSAPRSTIVRTPTTGHMVKLNQTPRPTKTSQSTTTTPIMPKLRSASLSKNNDSVVPKLIAGSTTAAKPTFADVVAKGTSSKGISSPASSTTTQSHAATNPASSQPAKPTSRPSSPTSTPLVNVSQPMNVKPSTIAGGIQSAGNSSGAFSTVNSSRTSKGASPVTNAAGGKNSQSAVSVADSSQPSSAAAFRAALRPVSVVKSPQPTPSSDNPPSPGKSSFAAKQAAFNKPEVANRTPLKIATPSTNASQVNDKPSSVGTQSTGTPSTPSPANSSQPSERVASPTPAVASATDAVKP